MGTKTTKLALRRKLFKVERERCAKPTVHLTIADRVRITAQTSRCGCECLGIMVNVETLQIERCDVCHQFDTDEQAAAFVTEVLQAAHRGQLQPFPRVSILGARESETDAGICTYCEAQGFHKDSCTNPRRTS